jgi:hypothetical protein
MSKQWEWMSYADGIYIAVEIVHLSRRRKWKEVFAKLSELNPLQAVYVFTEVQKQLADSPELLDLLVQGLAFEMNSINGQSLC